MIYYIFHLDIPRPKIRNATCPKNSEIPKGPVMENWKIGKFFEIPNFLESLFSDR